MEQAHFRRGPLTDRLSQHFLDAVGALCLTGHEEDSRGNATSEEIGMSLGKSRSVLRQVFLQDNSVITRAISCGVKKRDGVIFCFIADLIGHFGFIVELFQI